MIAIITMQGVDGDCPENITVDVDKLKALTIDDCKKRYKDYNGSEKTRLRHAQDDLEDARRYVKIITGEKVNDGEDISNPEGWVVLELAKVELPQMVDFTDVIFYGSY